MFCDFQCTDKNALLELVKRRHINYQKAHEKMLTSGKQMNTTVSFHYTPTTMAKLT